MEDLSRLRATLRQVLEQDTAHGEQDLFEELALHKQDLLRVCAVRGKDASERRELESGKTTVRGKQHAVNADFARHVLFISDQLGASERHVASLLQAATAIRPHFQPAEAVEEAVVLYHTRRRVAIDCLLLAFQAALESEESDAPTVCARIDTFARQHLLPPPIAGKDTLAAVILREMASIDEMLNRSLAAKQAAVSQTAVPSTTGGAGNLGHDILEARCRSLKQERRMLSGLLYLTSRLGCFAAGDVQKCGDWLHGHAQHATTSHVLTATILALASVAPIASSSSTANRRQELSKDTSLASSMRSLLAPTAKWAEPGLKAVLLLTWALFATDARRRSPSLEYTSGYTTEEVETSIWNGVQGDAFSYLTRLVRRTGRGGPHAEHVDEPDPTQPDPFDAEFVPAFLESLEVLLRALVRHASSELRKIKQRQEDVVLASARVTRGRLQQSMAAADADVGSQLQRNDIGDLYTLFGALYSSLPLDRALQFWGATSSDMEADARRSPLAYLRSLEAETPSLPPFVQWAAWSTQPADAGTLTALYSMLAGLATGPHCAELAYNFVARGVGDTVGGAPVISWSAIFGLLETWAAEMSTTKPQQPAPAPPGPFGSSMFARSQAPPPFVLAAKDVLLAQAFLRLLAAVVTHSVEVRKAIAGHSGFRAIPALVTLIPLGVPLELKGALFEALAAFCEPGAGAAGVEICRAVWSMMERMEVIALRPGVGALAVRGVEVELEEVESAHKLYPATLPFLHLLATLVHTPKRLGLRDRVLDSEPVNTVPEALGLPYRTPGIQPFVSFVVDHVFTQIPAREYARSSDRWRMNDLCLCFVERCLASYDLASLASIADSGRLTTDSLVPFIAHVGYDVMKRVLSATPLQNTLLSYVADGLDGFDRDLPVEEPFFHSTMVRVLRIIHRVLEIQDVYLDVVVPLAADLDNTGAYPVRSHFTALDQAIAFSPQLAPALASYVAFPAYEELVLLSVKILAQLAKSTSFSDLAILLERSSESDRILQGYCRILSVDTLQDPSEAETLVEGVTGAGATDPDGAVSMAQAIRLLALDLLLFGSLPGRPYPNVAHFLLFGHSQAEQIEDPSALGSQLTCVHVLIENLNAGVPRLNSRVGTTDATDMDPLFITLPALAERHMRVIQHLCMHPRLSEFTTRYLRTREDFFARQLAVVPSKAPPLQTDEDAFVEVVYADGSRTVSTASAISAFLRYRSLILDLAALELHTQTIRGHAKGIGQIMQLLYASDDGRGGDDEDNIFRTFREVGQSHLRIIELVQSLDFDWLDSLAVAPVDMRFLSTLDLRSCVRTDGAGCEVVDQALVLQMLRGTRGSLHGLGRVTSQADSDELEVEIAYVLESCVAENHRREIVHAVVTGFEAWRRLLDVSLFKCLDRLTASHRENMLFDVLYVLATIMRSSTTPPQMMGLLAEAVVSGMTKLREDHEQQLASASSDDGRPAATLPAERLHSLLRSLVDCILDPKQGELVRGNLYAALIDYLQLVRSASNIDTQTHVAPMGDLVPVALPGSLSKGSLTVIKEALGRLVFVVSRDALDGSEVWRTVAFVLLDALVDLADQDIHNTAIATMVKTGMLSNFVMSVRQEDSRLQAILLPDPDDINLLYVYEARMSMLVRASKTRHAAERLLEQQIITALSQCEYIDSRPDDDDERDGSGFLPAAIHRYHQLLMPAIQVVAGILGTLGQDHAAAGDQTLDFMITHRDVFVVILKANISPRSLEGMRETQMLVQLAGLVLPRVSKTELASSISAFGIIHAAILALASVILGSTSLADVGPQTESELADASITEPDSGLSRFHSAAEEALSLLQYAVVTYLAVASDATEPELALVLVPDLALNRNERASRYSALPSVMDAVHLLEEVARQLEGIAARLVELSAQVTRGQDRELATSLLVRTTAVPNAEAHLSRLYQQVIAEAHTIAGTLEVLLLLLWRHVEEYAQAELSVTLAVPTSLTQSTRAIVPHDKNAFCPAMARRLTPALQQLCSLELDDHDPTWRAHTTYVRVMTQRLLDILDVSQTAT